MASMIAATTILSEQVKLLYKQLGLGVIASLINAAVLCILLLDEQPKEVLAAWLAAVCLVNFPRLSLAQYFQKCASSQHTTQRWVHWLIISNLLSGAVWGAGAYFLFPAESLQHQLFLAFILAGMTAGGAPLYSALVSAYAAYMLPVLLPFALRLLEVGDVSQNYLALLVIFYAIVLLISSRRINAMIVDSLEQRYSNQRLMENLDIAQKKTEAINQQLLIKIDAAEAAERNTRRSNAILNAISQAQTRYMHDPDLQGLFAELLEQLLELTGSEYGFIGQLRSEVDGKLGLDTYALTSIQWDIEAQMFLARDAAHVEETNKLNSLFNAVIALGEMVIYSGADDVQASLVNGNEGVLLKAFIGVPFFHAGVMVGMFWLVNRPGGYTAQVVSELEPFLNTCSSIIQADYSSRLQRITEASLRETEAELGAIYAQIGEGIVSLDTRGQLLAANPATLRMLSVSFDELIGRGLQSFMQPADQPRWRDFLHGFSASDQQSASIDVSAIRAGNGAEFPLEIMLSRVHFSSGAHIIAVLRDVTERKKIERLKSEFIATVSHELRTPLTSIRGSLGLLQGGVVNADSEPGRNLLDIAVANCDSLGKLINDLLDMEKVESGGMKFNLERIRVRDLLQEAVLSNKAFAEQFNVVFCLDEALPDLALWADTGRLMQVLTNLLSNAVKFSKPGDSVFITAQSVGDRIRVEVRDKGRGIPQDFHNRIFEKFTQVDASDTRAVGGTGLGLSICKVLIEGMQGVIGFASTPEMGSTFFFELPAAQSVLTS